MVIRYTSFSLFMFALSILLVACDQSHQDIDHFINKEKEQAKVVKIASVPQFINYQPIVFTQTPKDPFAIPNVIDESLINDQKNQKFLTPLEKYSLDDLRLVGVINQGEKRWALIEIKTSKMVYPVSVGDYIGNRYGKIEAIDTKKVSIVEKIKSASGNWKEEKSELKL